MTELTQEYLKECFEYFPETGELIWKERPLYHFKNKQGQKSFNSRFAGKRAGSVSTKRGEKLYRHVYITHKRYSAFQEHRIIWCMIYGEFPKNLIDHVNQDKTDNRKINLRECSYSQNFFNKGATKNNKSGFKGVDKIGLKYRACIWMNKDQIYLGLYETAEEAYQAYCTAAEKIQGEFAVHLSQQESQS